MRIVSLLVVIAFGAGLANAQSLGEVARRERERRAALEKRAPTITNEDLQRPRILERAPEQAQAPRASASSLSCQPPAISPSPRPDSGVPLWKVAEQPGFSLGEYARRLREQRARREMEAQVASQASPAAPDALTAPPPLLAAQQLPAVQAAPAHSRRRHTRRLAKERPAVSTVGLRPLPDSDSAPDPIRVRRGDSLWKLSSIYLGEGKRWVSLWKANPEVRNADLIYPGQLLRWPGAPALARNIEQAAEKTQLSANVRLSNSSSARQKAAGQHQENQENQATWSAQARVPSPPHLPRLLGGSGPGGRSESRPRGSGWRAGPVLASFR